MNEHGISFQYPIIQQLLLCPQIIKWKETTICYVTWMCVIGNSCIRIHQKAPQNSINTHEINNNQIVTANSIHESHKSIFIPIEMNNSNKRIEYRVRAKTIHTHKHHTQLLSLNFSNKTKIREFTSTWDAKGKNTLPHTHWKWTTKQKRREQEKKKYNLLYLSI